ncbi:ATP phosphoribosyltransferase regulatory subunit [Emcibacter sp.]|uniref:ATP phosphoribosyltransferase regulatory subunit n=1 Tax=Emcibacter sp. TaxID=1979954 RepID=UPI003A925637
MLEPNDKALLPEGLHDTLANEAEYEAETVNRLLESFAAQGYTRVEPPLVEFEESLLSGPGAAQSRHMFRVMDPASQHMMGVRTDITGQVARIARTRLKKAPRPLRLSYAGQVLRIKGTMLRPERQFVQTGVELIGSDSFQAYVEVILLAHEALTSVGVEKLSLDLSLPLLVPAICEGLSIEEGTAHQVREALNARDVGELENIEGEIGDIARKLLSAAGRADKALETLDGLKLPEKARQMCDELAQVVSILADVAPGLQVTVDPGEYQGFEFQTGIGFTFFAKGVRGELGRGGRYEVNAELDEGEAATGFSLYLDSLMRALPEAPEPETIYVPFGTDLAELPPLRAEGYRTVQGLEPAGDAEAEARRLGCRRLWRNGAAEKLA